MSDLPDFTNYSQVDLIQQTIAFLTNRPMYGEAQQISDRQAVYKNEVTTLFTIYGKGKIYGGVIFFVNEYPVNSDMLQFYVDDKLVMHMTWENMLALNITQNNDYGFWLDCFDDENGNWCLSLKDGITFEESFSVKYYEREGYDKYLFYRVMYTLLNI